MNCTKINIHRYKEIGSTNDYALSNKDTLVCGDVVVADKQTNGHGRFDRKWFSDNEENVYLTVVLGEVSNLSAIPLYTAVILVRVLESLGVKANIKWPNDILVESKKIAGVLVQSAIQKFIPFAVVGVGFNIELTDNEKELIGNTAISLRDLGLVVGKNEFINMFLEKFFGMFNDFNTQGFSYIKDEYEFNSSLIGEQITVRCSKLERTGKVIGFSEVGEILLQENNQIVAITSGEVLKVL